eukprot:3762129-Prymnesium_polylepis.2
MLSPAASEARSTMAKSLLINSPLLTPTTIQSPAVNGSSGGAVGGVGGVGGAGGVGGGASGTGAVSYTHLRAHETLMNL